MGHSIQLFCACSTQVIHNECIPLNCNIVHDLKGTEMKTTHLNKLYDHIFMTYILQMFNKGTMSGLAGTVSVSNFSSHHVKQAYNNLCHCISHPLTFPNKWNVASSPKTILTVKNFSSSNLEIKKGQCM